MITRRTLLRSTAVAMAAAAPRVALGQPGVKIGTAVLADYALAGPVIVALEKAFFRQENANVDLAPFRGGPELLKAVLAGEVLIGLGGGPDILVAREAGSPVKMIAAHTEGNHFTLNVAPDVTAVGDLKGKAIGVTRAGSTTWVFARVLAKHQGWDPERDIKIAALGALDAQLAALGRKEIAAFIWGDGGVALEVEGKSKVLLRLDRFTPQWISQITYASETAIRKDAETIRKVLRGLFRALRFMKEHPEDAAPMVAKRLGWTPEAVLRAHRLSNGLFPFDGSFSVQALVAMQEVLLAHAVIKKRLPVEDHFTRDFIPVKLV
ncbi:MAG: ABC transporter substrate-binding protein [Candidatus Rokuibacteriota bacterium]